MGMTPQTCGSCGRRRLVKLQMAGQAGPVLTLLSCNACEHRSWLVDGAAAGVDAVLAAASGDEEFVLVPSRRTLRGRAQTAPPAGGRR